MHAPDVVEMPDTWQALYGNNGALEDLDPYIAKWDDASDLSDRAMQFGRAVGGKAYMLPYGFYLRALFYNKKLFEQAGIGPAEELHRATEGLAQGRHRRPEDAGDGAPPAGMDGGERALERCGHFLETNPISYGDAAQRTKHVPNRSKQVAFNRLHYRET